MEGTYNVVDETCAFWAYFNMARPGEPRGQNYDSWGDLLCVQVADPRQPKVKYAIGDDAPFDYVLYGSHGDLFVQGFFTVAGEDFRDALGSFTYLLFPINRLDGSDRLRR